MGNVWTSFDAKGWSKCATGYYMTGLFRNDCDNLYCIENFKCCKMGDAKKKFLGCFKDTKDRALPYNASHGGASVDTCVDQCGEKGYKYVGRQYDGECWCGNSGYDKYGLFTESKCDCDAQNVGPWRQCVYDISKAPTKSAPPPTKPPTKAPTKSPTNAPTKSPTNAPTKPPTNAPTKPPTKAPTTSPTNAPTTPPAPKTYENNWWSCFDDTNWCNVSGFMTGMYRNDRKSGSSDGIYLLEKASSSDAPFNLRGASSCVVANWWSSFDKKGWSLCNSGYYMRGMYRNSKTHGQGLHLIEQANCCKPNAQKGGWGTCYDLNVWTSFDAKGWSKCATGYYMTGLFRNDCDNLYCIENFKCCKMGAPTTSVPSFQYKALKLT